MMPVVQLPTSLGDCLILRIAKITYIDYHRRTVVAEPGNERLLTVTDVAEHLQVHPNTVRRHIKVGKLRGARWAQRAHPQRRSGGVPAARGRGACAA